LRGKRLGVFSEGARLREGSVRARASRTVRVWVRRGQIVVLQHARWSEPLAFLEELAVDLEVADSPVQAKVIDLGRMRVRRPSEAWSRFLSLVAELAQAPLASAAAWPVARAGFRHGLRQALDRITADRPPCVLLCAGAQHLPLEVVEDLGSVWSEWALTWDGLPPLRLVLAMEGGQAEAIVPGAVLVDLPDYSDVEALRYLVSRLGDEEVDDLRATVAAVGGLPAAVHEVAEVGGLDEPRAASSVRLALGAAFPAMLEAKTIVCSDDRLAARLESLEQAPQDFVDEVDPALRRAGLVRVYGTPEARRTALRSPLMARIEQATGQ
jgi:hypothetical protein